MAEIDFEIQGITPLVCHNGELADPDSEISIKLKSLTSQRKKSPETRAEISRVEWEGGLYWDDKLGPIMPEQNILASTADGAKINRQGRDIDAFVSMTTPFVAIEYKGPREPDKMWAAGMYDRRIVSSNGRPGGPKVVRVRPLFQPGWKIKFTLFVDEEMDPKDVVEAVKMAGKRVGLCERRKFRWGRFEVLKSMIRK